jgi:hypothetical protein
VTLVDAEVFAPAEGLITISVGEGEAARLGTAIASIG